LDKASEGLLLFTNDTRWAAKILDPQRHLEKTYHVQIDRVADENLIRQIAEGKNTEEGDFLSVKQVKVLRWGTRTCWLEIILDEGKNRQIRRLLSALGVGVLRLMRVAIGPIRLGNLPKGAHRRLTGKEIESLGKV
jgi:23S rRNA pseudouridine2605 synthase